MTALGMCAETLQGFGNVGGWAAELLELYGGRVIAVSDRNGAIFNRTGLDVRALKRHLRAQPPFGGHISSFPGGARGLLPHLNMPPQKRCLLAARIECTSDSAFYASRSQACTCAEDWGVTGVMAICIHAAVITALTPACAASLSCAGEPMPLEDVLKTPCDVLIPAAIPDVLDGETAAAISARIVVEVHCRHASYSESRLMTWHACMHACMQHIRSLKLEVVPRHAEALCRVQAANGPTTEEGDKVLRERGITVLPDIIANGGGGFFLVHARLRKSPQLFYSQRCACCTASWHGLNNLAPALCCHSGLMKGLPPLALQAAWSSPSSSGCKTSRPSGTPLLSIIIALCLHALWIAQLISLACVRAGGRRRR
jgi:hypothetical protein